MIQTILFATDLGVFTSHMLQHVVYLANSCGARVVVVHAVEPMGSFAHAVVKTYMPKQSCKALGDEAVERMLFAIKTRVRDVLVSEYMDGIDNFDCIDDVRVVQGEPAKVILQEAAVQCADLIIMGSHGPNAINSHMLGSVTDKVLQLARIPVFMVPMVNPAQYLCSENRHQMHL
ncbi:MAG: universal stress protein [Exilibacterium sp.]